MPRRARTINAHPIKTIAKRASSQLNARRCERKRSSLRPARARRSWRIKGIDQTGCRSPHGARLALLHRREDAIHSVADQLTVNMQADRIAGIIHLCRCRLRHAKRAQREQQRSKQPHVKSPTIPRNTLSRRQDRPAQFSLGADLGAGAGEGNRTLVCSLGSCRSTIELRPRSQLLEVTPHGCDRRTIARAEAADQACIDTDRRAATRYQPILTSTSLITRGAAADASQLPPRA